MNNLFTEDPEPVCPICGEPFDGVVAVVHTNQGDIDVHPECQELMADPDHVARGSHDDMMDSTIYGIWGLSKTMDGPWTPMPGLRVEPPPEWSSPAPTPADVLRTGKVDPLEMGIIKTTPYLPTTSRPSDHHYWDGYKWVLAVDLPLAEGQTADDGREHSIDEIDPPVELPPAIADFLREIGMLGDE
jgi:hypothetical protein